MGAKKGKHLKAFWKAQCAFRGLDVNGRVDELVDRLRTTEHKPVFPELVKMQKDLRQKAADELEDAWKNRLTDSQKADDLYRVIIKPQAPATHNKAVVVIVAIDTTNSTIISSKDKATSINEQIFVRTCSVNFIFISFSIILTIHHFQHSRAIMSDFDLSDFSVRRKMLPIERKFGNKKLIYDGYGMKSNNHTFDSQLETRFSSADVSGTRSEPFWKAALSLGLVYKSLEVSKFDEPPLQRDLCSLIHKAVGRTVPAVKDKLQEIHQIRGKAILKAREAMKNARDIISEAHDDVIRASDDKTWDVTGDWHISCLEMERRWYAPLTLRIYSQESDGQCQLFDEFDFDGVSGLFRFEQRLPTVEKNSARLADPNVKRENITFGKAEKGKKDDNDEDIKCASPNAKRFWCKYTAEAFSFPSAEKPSFHNPTWNYRWRGEYKIDSEPVPGQYLCSIIFSERLGTTLTGTFGGDLYRTWKKDMVFTGVKVGIGGDPSIDIEKEWHDRQNIIYDSDIQD
ncbi:hypothetical protein BHYA_0076g00070 [Botrytis hyacinthi]|uniref:Uncharacterized protein n=1 Tax=Botrytis hyacinthi TaxID=278943 RepID=A0A4Z1GN37_9HELO|nr:hypothetical protein BHYA_0076g00070 [Botrytis hyacinthi]